MRSSATCQYRATQNSPSFFPLWNQSVSTSHSNVQSQNANGHEWPALHTVHVTQKQDIMRNSTKRAVSLAAAAITGVLVLAGCGGDPLKSGSGGGGDSSAITVSSANFPEAEIIANIYSGALQSKGIKVNEKFNIGSREAYVPAIEKGDIDLIPEYTGNLLAYLDPKADASTPEKIDDGLAKVLPEKKLSVLNKAPGEDKDAIVVTQQTAKDWNLKSIADLQSHQSELTVGGPPEFNTRQTGMVGIKSAYGVSAASYEPISDGGGPATVKALVDGKVKAANIFTTSPAITANNLVALEDPKNVFPAQNVIPLIREDKVTDQVKEALNAVSEKLTTEELLKLNTEVSGDAKKEPKKAAQDWLKDKGLS